MGSVDEDQLLEGEVVDDLEGTGARCFVLAEWPGVLSTVNHRQGGSASLELAAGV